MPTAPRRSQRPCPHTTEHGFTFVMVMFIIVLMGISMIGIAQEWSVTMRRDREAELYFRGMQIKTALEGYAASHAILKATRPNVYPLSLKDLTKKKPKKFLRRVYTDPITGEDFELIKNKQEIIGVRSTSDLKPYDTQTFKNAKRYKDIRFEVTLQQTACAPGQQTSPTGQPCPTTAQGTTGQTGTASSTGSTPQAPTTGAPAPTEPSSPDATP